MNDPFLNHEAIEAATGRFDALTEEVGRITGRSAGVDHTGGGCLAYVVETSAGSVVATVGFDDGSPGDPKWGTEPDVPETEDGPWFASFWPLETWLTGSVDDSRDEEGRSTGRDSSPISGIRLEIYKSSLGDCSNGGISGAHDRVTVVNIDGPFDPDEAAPAILLLPGAGAGTVRAVPAELAGEGVWVPLARPKAIGPMAGGCYVATSDARFSEKVEEIVGARFYGAVAFHDRYETQAEYDLLSM